MAERASENLRRGREMYRFGRQRLTVSFDRQQRKLKSVEGSRPLIKPTVEATPSISPAPTCKDSSSKTTGKNDSTDRSGLTGWRVMKKRAFLIMR